MKIIEPGLLRENVVPPSAEAPKAYLKTREKRLAFDRLQDEIWREFLHRLKKPVRIRGGRSHRIVEVLGTVQYLVSRETGEIHSALRQRPGTTSESFGGLGKDFLVDLPLMLKPILVDAFLSSWDTELSNVGPEFTSLEPRDPNDDILSVFRAASEFHYAVVSSFYRAIRKSVNWKQLRYRVRDALALDPEVLDIARRSRPLRHGQTLSDRHYNCVIRKLGHYRQVRQDAPNLLWLLTVCLEERIPVSPDDPVRSIRDAFLRKECGPRGWRLVAKHHQRDFAPAVEYTGRKWNYLVEYVQLHNTLDRNAPIPKRVGHLFTEPAWDIRDEGIEYRRVLLPASVLNAVIDEAAARDDVGSFLEYELATVLAWLEQSGVALDSNQARRGWEWLIQAARAWIAEREQEAALSGDAWPCALGETTIRGYHFVPLADAWSVRQEALRYRHCADNFIDHCRDGYYRLYAVFDAHGRHKATLGLVFSAENWQVAQIKGFANRPVSWQLASIAESLSAGLDLVEEGKATRDALEAAGVPGRLWLGTMFIHAHVDDGLAEVGEDEPNESDEDITELHEGAGELDPVDESDSEHSNSGL